MPNNTEAICVITAATGHRHLARCLKSVQEQTLSSVLHYVVIDGPEHTDRVREALNCVAGGPKPVQVLQLTQPTGKDGWLGHRIYGAVPFIVNHAWVCFLDEDNWFEPDHLTSLLHAALSGNAQWGFALRKLYDSEGKFLFLDECESLGTLHPIYHRDDVRLVDTNCYLLRREVAVMFSSIWHRVRKPAGISPPDFKLCMTLLEHKIPGATNRRYTVNYTVGSEPDSPLIDVLREGNALMHQRYPAGLPWE